MKLAPLAPTSMPSNPSLGWECLQDVFYRSRECFQMQWALNSTESEPYISSGDFHVSISPNGAHIAVISLKHNEQTYSIDIFSGSGQLLSSIPWLNSIGTIISIGWTTACCPIIVLKSGKYRIYHDLKSDFDEYSFSNNNDIISAKFSTSYFAVMASDGKVYCITDFDNPSEFSLNCANIDDEISDSKITSFDVHSWVIIPPSRNYGTLRAVASVSGKLCIWDQASPDLTESIDKDCSYSLMATSPNSELIALYSYTRGEISICTTDFKHTLNVQKLETPTKPLALGWCGNDAVVLSYPDELTFVGPTNDTLSFYTNMKAVIRSEEDGVLFLTDKTLGWISRVSQVTSNVFKIGSTAPSAILLDAVDLLDNHSPRANENIEIISDSLTKAIDGCVDAASEELEPYWQKKLLRAASLGKISSRYYNADRFVRMCTILRILNMLRQPEIGIFLTFKQYTRLGVNHVIRLLLLRNLHYLCIKIADALNISKDDIYLHWASAKIKASPDMPEKELASVIIHRLKGKHVSFAVLAMVAYQEGRGQLSVKLLNQEEQTSRAIPLLLNMEQDDYALLKADEDADVDSICYVLLHLYSKTNFARLFKLLDGKINAIGVFKENFSQIDDHILYDYYYQDDYIPGLAILDLQRFFQKDQSSSSLESRKADLLKASRVLLRSKSTLFEGEVLKNTAALIEYQKELHREEPTTTSKYEPVVKTIKNLCLVNLKKAVTLQKKFKVDEKQFYYTMLNTLAVIPEKRRELYDFATSKKSPIGYVPFFQKLLAVGDKKQANMYIPLCSEISYKEKARCYLECDNFREAVNEVSKKRNVELLESMKPLASNQTHLRLITDNIESINGTRRFG